MPDTINVVEPTLMNETGHCYSFINAFCQASDRSRMLHLWVGYHAKVSFPVDHVLVKKFFFRHIRRLQSFFLYKKLLSKSSKLFISTAGRTDLLLLNWASGGKIPPKKVYLYFHWVSADDKKISSLRKIARHQPNLEILGPTQSVINIFQEAGFRNACVVPYPISKNDLTSLAEPRNFKHLLYAGAARKDKGFSHVVDLVAYLHEQDLQIPVLLQTSPEHYNKYDPAILADIQRLHNIAYPHLRLCTGTLSANEYADLFVGAICLQLYSAAHFSDRISGVTLDAFSAGCPVIATNGTWIARMTQRFNAGVVVENMSPLAILHAAQQAIDDYPHYNRQALEAGKILQKEFSAEALFNALVK